MDRHWDENPKVLVFYSQWTKPFVINLLFTTKQYKVDNIDNFVYYGKTRKEKQTRIRFLLTSWDFEWAFDDNDDERNNLFLFHSV